MPRERREAEIGGENRQAREEAAVPVFAPDGALSREFLLRRGYCCGNGCRYCPYPAPPESRR